MASVTFPGFHSKWCFILFYCASAIFVTHTHTYTKSVHPVWQSWSCSVAFGVCATAVVVDMVLGRLALCVFLSSFNLQNPWTLNILACIYWSQQQSCHWLQGEWSLSKSTTVCKNNFTPGFTRRVSCAGRNFLVQAQTVLRWVHIERVHNIMVPHENLTRNASGQSVLGFPWGISLDICCWECQWGRDRAATTCCEKQTVIFHVKWCPLFRTVLFVWDYLGAELSQIWLVPYFSQSCVKDPDLWMWC